MNAAQFLSLCETRKGFSCTTRASCATAQVVGRMTSGNYGYTIGRACGIGYVLVDTVDPVDTVDTVDTVDSGTFTVDCGGIEYEADLSERPFYDPANIRLKG